MPNKLNHKKGFYNWITKSLKREIPDGTQGFHFNLYEAEDSVHVQLMGMGVFEYGEDPIRDYWPGNETFSTGEIIYEIPLTQLGVNWKEWLDSIIALLMEYIESVPEKSILKQYKGIGVGFVDGDMHLIWQPPLT